MGRTSGVPPFRNVGYFCCAGMKLIDLSDSCWLPHQGVNERYNQGCKNLRKKYALQHLEKTVSTGNLKTVLELDTDSLNKNG
jgi:hypothetical protein